MLSSTTQMASCIFPVLLWHKPKIDCPAFGGANLFYRTFVLFCSLTYCKPKLRSLITPGISLKNRLAKVNNG